MDINTSNLDIDALLPTQATGQKDQRASKPTTKGTKETKKAEAQDGAQIMKAVRQSSRASNAAAAKVTDENAAEKQSMILKIHRYLIDERFGPYLRELGFNHTTASLNKKDTTALQAELDKIKVCVSSKNGNQMISGAVLGAIKGSELVLSRYYDIRGLSASLQSDDHFLDTLREVELEHQSFAYVNPKIRLAGIVGVKAIGVNQMHQMMKKATQGEKNKIYDELVKKPAERKAAQQRGDNHTETNTQQDTQQEVEKDTENNTQQDTENNTQQDTEDPRQLDFVGLGTLQPTVPINPLNEVKDQVKKKPARMPVKPVKKKPAIKKEPNVRKEPKLTTVKKKSTKKVSIADDDGPGPDAENCMRGDNVHEPVTLSLYSTQVLAGLSEEAANANREFMRSMADIELPNSFLGSRK